MPRMFGAVASVREYILNLAGSTSNAGFGGLIAAILGARASHDRRPRGGHGQNEEAVE